MKNSIIVGLIVIALIVSNIPSARAEPITLRVMAIVGVVTVAGLAAADEVIHEAGIATADFQPKQPTEMVDRQN